MQSLGLALKPKNNQKHQGQDVQFSHDLSFSGYSMSADSSTAVQTRLFFSCLLQVRLRESQQEAMRGRCGAMRGDARCAVGELTEVGVGLDGFGVYNK